MAEGDLNEFLNRKETSPKSLEKMFLKSVLVWQIGDQLVICFVDFVFPELESYAMLPFPMFSDTFYTLEVL